MTAWHLVAFACRIALIARHVFTKMNCFVNFVMSKIATHTNNAIVYFLM